MRLIDWLAPALVAWRTEPPRELLAFLVAQVPFDLMARAPSWTTLTRKAGPVAKGLVLPAPSVARAWNWWTVLADVPTGTEALVAVPEARTTPV